MRRLRLLIPTSLITESKHHSRSWTRVDLSIWHSETVRWSRGCCDVVLFTTPIPFFLIFWRIPYPYTLKYCFNKNVSLNSFANLKWIQFFSPFLLSAFLHHFTAVLIRLKWLGSQKTQRMSSGNSPAEDLMCRLIYYIERITLENLCAFHMWSKQQHRRWAIDYEAIFVQNTWSHR